MLSVTTSSVSQSNGDFFGKKILPLIEDDQSISAHIPIVNYTATYNYNFDYIYKV